MRRDEAPKAFRSVSSTQQVLTHGAGAITGRAGRTWPCPGALARETPRGAAQQDLALCSFPRTAPGQAGLRLGSRWGFQGLGIGMLGDVKGGPRSPWLGALGVP